MFEVSNRLRPLLGWLILDYRTLYRLFWEEHLKGCNTATTSILKKKNHQSSSLLIRLCLTRSNLKVLSRNIHKKPNYVPMIVFSAFCIHAQSVFAGTIINILCIPRLFFFFLQELLKTLSVDAYVVVFSVNNPSTFQIAKDNLNKIRNELKINKTIILVANKIDLVRKRAVPANGITIFFYSKSLLFKKKKKKENVS